jgi:hypothetical protein
MNYFRLEKKISPKHARRDAGTAACKTVKNFAARCEASPPALPLRDGNEASFEVLHL